MTINVQYKSQTQLKLHGWKEKHGQQKLRMIEYQNLLIMSS